MWRSMEHADATFMVVFILATTYWTVANALLNSASLAGKLEACTNEGEEVPVLSIRDMDCFKCKCINYFVVCEPQSSCPSVDDCYMLEKKHGCCEKCKDCVYKGVRYPSGAEWTAVDDPCSHLKCVAGVVTVSNLQCYTPCINPVPPRPGQCCPTCDGCYLNGQNVDDNLDGDGDGHELLLAEDPCLKCSCLNNTLLHCAKHACPVLQCPVSKQRHVPGECCPRCAEKRPIGPLPGGKCVLGTGFHANGQSFRHFEHLLPVVAAIPSPLPNVNDNYSSQRQPLLQQFVGPAQAHHDDGLTSLNAQLCTATISACTCLNGTSVCRKRTCPVLECAPELQSRRPEADCCAVCPVRQSAATAGAGSGAGSNGSSVALVTRSVCEWRGQVYAVNATWTVGACKSCRCVAGEVRCVWQSCPKLKCKANESAVKEPGHCCPQCEEAAGICTVFGDPHYRTFDGRFYSFMGSCKYQLTGDCANNTFAIRVTNEDRHTRSSAWTKTVTLRLGATKVNLGQKMRVKINGTRILPPYSTTAGPYWLTVTNTSDGIHVGTGLGVQLLWDGNNFLQVSAAAARFKNRSLCGLCGNYNGVWRDDLISRNGEDHSAAVWRFGNSWRVGGARVCARKRENLARVPECHRSRAVPAVCRQLLETEVFARCTGHLNPQYYVESCKDDMCECPTHKCYCDSFAAYARECKRQGVDMGGGWKQVVGCEASELAAAAAVAAAAAAATASTATATTISSTTTTTTTTAVAVARFHSAMLPEISLPVTHETSPLLSSNHKHQQQRVKRPHHGARRHQPSQPHKIGQMSPALLAQHHQHHQHHNNHEHRHKKPKQSSPYIWGEADFMSRHIPKTFLIPRPTGRTPPPIH